MTRAQADLSLTEMLDIMRRNGYSPVGMPVPDSTVVHPGLVRHHSGLATQLVLPVFGDATVTRVRCSLDTAQPGLLITSVVFTWSDTQEKVVRWLMEEDGLLPMTDDQP
ncbi:hypothetical protein [Lentzea sp. CA-135723]|uniref:hypothetical protein n=1 Tax=Lentzea sp. CA-135723 TaxID=3239950 RepID=UPI003D92A9DD